MELTVPTQKSLQPVDLSQRLMDIVFIYLPLEEHSLSLTERDKLSILLSEVEDLEVRVSLVQIMVVAEVEEGF
jgi:hypothetical protein